MAEPRLIPLTQGQFAIVDAADYEWLSQWKWHAGWNKHTQGFYVKRGVRLGSSRFRTDFMHRLILGLEHADRRQGDHWNGNTLDNRRDNLRIATYAQNTQNARPRKDNPSGYKGVQLHRGVWCAQITVNGKKQHLGSFSTPELAHAAYCEAAKKAYGEFARFA
jgi:hypothetical protein